MTVMKSGRDATPIAGDAEMVPVADATIGTADVRIPSGAASANGCVFFTKRSVSHNEDGVS